MSADARRPLIVAIQRHSRNDGPGIRTAVFFKGCPLRCVFCQNPETQDPQREIAFSESRCISCGSCRSACPRAALDFSVAGRIRRDRCDRCGVCADVCPAGALRVAGAHYPVEALAEILLRDLPFYRHSGGGITLTGGECTMYADYLESLLRLVKEHQVHVALETAGCFDYDIFREQIFPYVDLVYFDVKFADPALHQQYVGCSNRRILRNLARLLRQETIAVHPRIPLVPGLTATEENLRAIARLLKQMGAKEASLVPYNPLGLGTWVKLGKARPCLPESFMPGDEEKAICASFRRIVEEMHGALAPGLVRGIPGTEKATPAKRGRRYIRPPRAAQSRRLFHLPGGRAATTYNKCA
jgi:pyruvate formate lyase activating enzyme